MPIIYIMLSRRSGTQRRDEIEKYSPASVFPHLTLNRLQNPTSKKNKKNRLQFFIDYSGSIDTI
jgi:hypothetical protein